jgi:RNA-splicing ligase RtcB
VPSDPRSHSGPFDLIAERRCRFRLTQVANVASLPGIVEASYAMPHMHLGYGFPIGGVAATDVDAGGVVSPGGAGRRVRVVGARARRPAGYL